MQGDRDAGAPPLPTPPLATPPATSPTLPPTPRRAWPWPWRRTALPGTVVALGVVSLLTDLSADMVVPLLPALVASLGSGPAFLGLLEGVAQATIAALRLLSGWLSDRTRRKPWILLGYGLSAAARPLLALAPTPLFVLALRSADRVGKGLRSSPRDALVADVTPSSLRGAAFGLQRGMDHAGALLGALLAFALLEAGGLSLRAVFAVSVVPGALAVVVLAACVREGSRPQAASRPPAPSSPAPNPAATSPLLRRYLAVVALATLGTFPELLLIQRALDVGVAANHVLLLWAALHITRSALALPLGAASDRLGRRGVLALGHIVAALVLLGFAAAREAWQVWLLFAAHGLHAALTEGAERAMVADLAGAATRGRAFGAFYVVSGLAALGGGTLLGTLYQGAGAGMALSSGAALSAVAAAALWVVARPAPTPPR